MHRCVQAETIVWTSRRVQTLVRCAGVFWFGTCSDWAELRFTGFECTDGIICVFLFLDIFRHLAILLAFYQSSSVKASCDHTSGHSDMFLFHITQIPVLLLVPSLNDGQWAADVVLHPLWSSGHPWADEQAPQLLPGMPPAPSRGPALNPNTNIQRHILAQCVTVELNGDTVTNTILKLLVLFTIILKREDGSVCSTIWADLL